ncbi:MAG TPA: DUF192 domain-containing protein [Bryobacteraceae bacterium]|nr:DUF192 domain-containing protein [Bryobacteraceae bacterium]
MLRTFLSVAALLLCGCSDKDTLNELGTTIVTLPDGQKIRAEVLTHAKDMLRGMMFRDSLPKDCGMLFIHGSPGRYPYWMYQVNVPLDILWIDPNKNVVEVSLDTAPCRSKSAQECPNYGGNAVAVYVLELAAGTARKHGVNVGSRLSF